MTVREIGEWARGWWTFLQDVLFIEDDWKAVQEKAEEGWCNDNRAE